MDGFEGLGAVLFVLVLLGGALVLLRRGGMAAFALPRFSASGGGTPRQVEIVERVPLGPQHSLSLVRVGNSKWLVGTSPGGCVLRPVSDQEELE